ncbi:MAG: hypothetical protein Q7T23_12050 [Phenylobacterium sp.]|nr:hypothetical protein [Phenylobacterium sp.]
MSVFRTIGGKASAFALMLACMAIALRVFIPQGYMLAPGADSGSVPIVLCTPQGARTVSIDAAGHIVDSPTKTPTDPSGSPAADHPCAFSGSGVAFAAEPPMLVVLAGLRWVHVSVAVESQTTPGRGLAAPPPPPTGPPLQI